MFVAETKAQVTKTLNGTVRYESGMSETKFSTPNGDVVMKLPQSMSGTTITGTVSAVPAGKTEKEKSRNLKELLKHTVMLDGQKIPVSATPTNFDWLTHLDRQLRTPMELLNVTGAKIAEVSLPPVLSKPAILNSSNVPHLTTPSNVLVKGDALNVYTDQQFSSGEKFVLTDSKGQQFTLAPICLSLQQAVMKVPEGVVPGNCTIREEVTNQPLFGNNISSADFKMIDIDLSSPNTNLRSGQTSSVTVVCHQSNDAGIAANVRELFLNTPQVLTIDLRNLEPNTVSMTGGNFQRINFPLSNNQQDAAPLQVTRTITGIKPGSFSVSATLHEDYNTSNDPFRPQLNVLKTPEDFNAWTNALKKDLKEYAGMHDNDLLGKVVKTNAQRAIDNMPVCTSPEQLDECKAVAYSLVQPLHIPKGAAISWLSSYEALKALVNNLAGNSILTDFDVLKNGIEFINRVTQNNKETAMQSECGHVQELLDQVQTTGETKENLQELKDKIKRLTVRADIIIQADDHLSLKTGMKDLKLASYQLPSLASPGRVHPYNDLIGFLDPVKKTLFVLPEYSSKVLSMINAEPLANGQYHIISMTANRKPIAYDISVVAASQFLLFDEAGKKPDDTKKDKVKPEPAKEEVLEWTGFEHGGINYCFYKGAICVNETGPKKDDDCVLMLGFKVDDPNASYIKTEYMTRGRCKKGIGFCLEMYKVISISYSYYDKNCTNLVKVKGHKGYTCQ